MNAAYQNDRAVYRTHQLEQIVLRQSSGGNQMYQAESWKASETKPEFSAKEYHIDVSARHKAAALSVQHSFRSYGCLLSSISVCNFSANAEPGAEWQGAHILRVIGPTNFLAFIYAEVSQVRMRPRLRLRFELADDIPAPSAKNWPFRLNPQGFLEIIGHKHVVIVDEDQKRTLRFLNSPGGAQA